MELRRSEALSRSVGDARRWWWKRPLDLCAGGLLLLLLLPVILILALVIRIDSGGPAFYRQERVGRHGVHFRMWKLRTMAAHCDQAPHRQAAADWFAGRDQEGQFKSLADPRITRAGRWLRRTNLDELPQLVNVLKGEMSLVGPRPAIPYELAYYRPTYFERLDMLPGITGPWQVSNRECVSAPAMMALDIEYVRSATPWLDLRILVRTAWGAIR